MSLLVSISVVLFIGCVVTQSTFDVEHQLAVDQVVRFNEVLKQLDMIYRRFNDELGALRDGHDEIMTKLAKLEEMAIASKQGQGGIKLAIEDQAAHINLLEEKLEGVPTFLADINTTLAKHDLNSNKFTCDDYAKDCGDLYRRGNRISAVYSIHPVGASKAKEVYCDFSDEEAWTMILRRTSADLSFDRDWANYRQGFGDASGDFWLGLESIHLLTKQGLNKIKFEFTHKGSEYYAMYNKFVIGSESNGFILLEVGDHSGNTTEGDRLSYNKDSKFSTRDRKHDSHFSNCAAISTGGWWFESRTYVCFTCSYGCTGDCARWLDQNPITDITMKLG